MNTYDSCVPGARPLASTLPLYIGAPHSVLAAQQDSAFDAAGTAFGAVLGSSVVMPIGVPAGVAAIANATQNVVRVRDAKQAAPPRGELR